MKVEYSKRAISDLLDIAAYHAGTGHPDVGEGVAVRIRRVVARLAAAPASGRPVRRREGLRVVPLLRYPYLVFYRVMGADTLRIVHIRHTSRRSWFGC